MGNLAHQRMRHLGEFGAPPINFNGFRVLAALLHGTLVVGVSQTAALNRGCHLYSAGRPSRWSLAHIVVIYFSRSNLRGRRMPPRGTAARMSQCGIIQNADQTGALSVPSHFEGRKSANFTPPLGDGAALNWCNLKMRLQIKKLKQMRQTTSIIIAITSSSRIRGRPCSCCNGASFLWSPNCTIATISRFPQQRSTEGATYIRRACHICCCCCCYCRSNDDSDAEVSPRDATDKCAASRRQKRSETDSIDDFVQRYVCIILCTLHACVVL